MPVEYSINVKGLEEQQRKLGAYNRIYTRHVSRALKKGAKHVQKRWVRIAPIDTFAYRRDVANNMQVQRFNSGEIAARVWTTLKYPIYLETMDRYHYRRTARTGQRTRGHVQTAAAKSMKMVNKLIEKAIDKITKDLEVR